VRIVPVIFLLLISTAFGSDDAAKSAARRVDQHYNALKTVRMDFQQSLASAGIERSDSGTLELKKPGKMRWDYTAPQNKLFVSDGKTAYFYVPGERQARKAPVKKLDDLQSPLRFLLGKSRLESELEDIKLEGKVLSGVPKHLKDRVSRVWLTITPGNQIERIVIEEIDGTRTEFAFSNMQENVALADSRFRFQVPEGVEMVQAQELQP
jgi:outer membrane lipoprotein carrier protein